MSASRTARLFDAMLAEEHRERAEFRRQMDPILKAFSWQYRTGDLTHQHLGDVEVECFECHGAGRIETDKEGSPWRVEHRDCPTCHGRGTVWQEAPDAP